VVSATDLYCRILDFLDRINGGIYICIIIYPGTRCSVQLDAPASLSSWKRLLVPVVHETGWARERGTSLIHSAIESRFIGQPLRSVVAVPNTIARREAET
jgi:hypothetical protein